MTYRGVNGIVKTLKIVKKAIGQPPEVIRISHTLKSLRKNVGGGFIEIIRLGAGIVLVIDEEGKLNGSKPNFDVADDVVMGDAFFVEEGMVNGQMDFKDLKDWQIKLILSEVGIKFDEPKNEPDMTFDFISW
jgi:hypothetical protein